MSECGGALKSTTQAGSPLGTHLDATAPALKPRSAPKAQNTSMATPRATRHTCATLAGILQASCDHTRIGRHLLPTIFGPQKLSANFWPTFFADTFWGPKIIGHELADKFADNVCRQSLNPAFVAQPGCGGLVPTMFRAGAFGMPQEGAAELSNELFCLSRKFPRTFWDTPKIAPLEASRKPPAQPLGLRPADATKCAALFRLPERPPTTLKPLGRPAACSGAGRIGAEPWAHRTAPLSR